VLISTSLAHDVVDQDMSRLVTGFPTETLGKRARSGCSAWRSGDSEVRTAWKETHDDKLGKPAMYENNGAAAENKSPSYGLVAFISSRR